MRHVAVFVVIVLAGLVSSAGGANLDAQKAQSRKQHEQHLKTIREAPGIFKMHDLCRIARKGGKFTLTSNLPDDIAKGQQVRIKVEGLNDIVVVQAMARGGYFQFQHYDWSDPQFILVTTTIGWSGQHFNINRGWQGTDGHRNVALNQFENFDGMPGSPRTQINFNVNRSGRGGNVNINGQAPDFPTLRRQYRAAMDEHLRPILRDLELESILAVDPVVAQQVFADLWSADAGALRRIEKILPRLDADAFQEREAALKELRAVGQAGALAVHHMDRRKLTAQQNMLLDAFLGPFITVTAAEAHRLRRDADFLVDCLYSPEKLIRGTALGQLRGISRLDLELDIDADPTTQYKAIDAIRAALLSGSKATTAPTTRPRSKPLPATTGKSGR